MGGAIVMKTNLEFTRWFTEALIKLSIKAKQDKKRLKEWVDRKLAANPNWLKEKRLKEVEKERIRKRQWREKNRDTQRQINDRSNKKHRAKDPDRYAKYARRYYWKDPEKARLAAREFRVRNKERIKIQKHERMKDPQYRIMMNIRQKVRRALSGRRKSDSAMRMLGCTHAELLRYLESKFQPGMDWSNYGYGPDKWCADHVRPLASFNLTDPLQQKLACHFTNLQPLFCNQNSMKTSFWNGKMWRHDDHNRACNQLEESYSSNN